MCHDGGALSGHSGLVRCSPASMRGPGGASPFRLQCECNACYQAVSLPWLSLTQWSIVLRNSRPHDVVIATSINDFERGLEHCMRVRSINGC